MDLDSSNLFQHQLC